MWLAARGSEAQQEPRGSDLKDFPSHKRATRAGEPSTAGGRLPPLMGWARPLGHCDWRLLFSL